MVIIKKLFLYVCDIYYDASYHNKIMSYNLNYHYTLLITVCSNYFSHSNSCIIFLQFSEDFEIYEQHCAFETINLNTLDEALNDADFRAYVKVTLNTPYQYIVFPFLEYCMTPVLSHKHVYTERENKCSLHSVSIVFLL